MSRPPCSRRSFLKRLTATTLLAPFADQWLLSPQQASAAPPKRVMFVYVPDGAIPAKWHPTGSEKSFTLAPMSEPLESIREHLVFLSGLTMYAGGATHEGGIAKVLTGVSDVSLDIFLGDKLGTDTPFRSLQLGVGSTFENGSGSMTFVGPNQPVSPDDNPLNVFSRVFGGGAGAGDDAALERRRKKSVLDAALADLSALRSRLGRTERERLELHLSSLREVEARITRPPSTACGVGSFNAEGFAVIETDYYPKTFHKEENFETIGKLQMDLATLALSCGSTRTVSLMWSHPVSPTHIRETGVTLGNHDASHYGDPSSTTAADFVKLKRWFMEQFVYLIEKLAETPDGDGFLIDNTLVLLCSELGDSNRHDHDDVPFVLAGRAGGALETGRSLRYNGKNAGQNEPHTKLLVSIAQAMGVDIDRYGYTGHGTGTLNGLLR